MDSAKRNLSLYETKGSRERDRKTERVRTKSFMGQTSRRCCWHMAGISAGFEATKVEACFKPSQKRDERGRKVRKVGLFLF